MRATERAITIRTMSLSLLQLLKNRTFKRKRSYNERRKRRWLDSKNSRAMVTWSSQITNQIFLKRSSLKCNYSRLIFITQYESSSSQLLHEPCRQRDLFQLEKTVKTMEQTLKPTQLSERKLFGRRTL